MKKNSIISLIITCSFIAWIFWAVLAVKILDKGEIDTSDVTWEMILSLQSELNSIKSEKSETNTSVNIWSLENNIIDITKKASKSVVSIIVKKDLVVYKSDPWGFFKQPVWSVEKKVWGWTGFFLTKDWKILTNKHVVSDREAEYTVINSDWKEYEAKVLAVDPLSDLAIIKIELGEWEDAETLNFIENKEEIKIGQFVIAIWNKLWEFENSVSLGLVSWTDRIIKDKNINLSNLIQTDADIHPWNSWWPLINLSWKVIWINTAIVQDIESIGFAIEISKKKIKYMLESIEKYWDIKRPFLWISYIPLSEWIMKQFWLRSAVWVYIINEPWAVIKWSNADKIWLEPWDIISEVDEIPLEWKNTLNSIIQWKLPWDKLKIKVIKQSWEIKRLDLVLWSI